MDINSRKDRIRKMVRQLASEVYEFIQESEGEYPDRWVPAADIKNTLGLRYSVVPRSRIQYSEKGWLFAILARMLEDDGRLEYKKVGSRAFYRSRK